MAGQNRVKTRFLILSDTHNALPSAKASDQIFRQPLPDADVVVHCGDLTMSGKPRELANAVRLLKDLHADLKIVIPGNHDLTLDQTYCRTHPRLYGWDRNHTEDDLDLARELFTNKAAQDAGIVYIEEGVRTFRLENGAIFTIYASAYTPEFCDWGFPYSRSEDRYNPPTARIAVPEFKKDAEESNIEIMITHGPPQCMLDMTVTNVPAGCEHLRKAVSRAKPLLHCFGHIHEGWGAVQHQWRGAEDWTNEDAHVHVEVERKNITQDRCAYFDGTKMTHGRETLFVNASIMDVDYHPSQSPWLVDLLLRRSDSSKVISQEMDVG